MTIAFAIVLGFFGGIVVGVFVAAILSAASDADDSLDEAIRRRREDEDR